MDCNCCNSVRVRVERVYPENWKIRLRLFRPRARGTSLYSFLVSVSVFIPSACAWNKCWEVDTSIDVSYSFSTVLLQYLFRPRACVEQVFVLCFFCVFVSFLFISCLSQFYHSFIAVFSQLFRSFLAFLANDNRTSKPPTRRTSETFRELKQTNLSEFSD